MDVLEARKFLEDNHIVYIIMETNKTFPFDIQGVPLKPVFSNSRLTIYQYRALSMTPAEPVNVK